MTSAGASGSPAAHGTLRLVGSADLAETDGAATDDGRVALWFPAAPLLDAAATGERLARALGALDGQARLLEDLLAACAVGAAVLPPAMLAAVRVAHGALVAAHDAGASTI